jgi:hypothetical protein
VGATAPRIIAFHVVLMLLLPDTTYKNTDFHDSSSFQAPDTASSAPWVDPFSTPSPTMDDHFKNARGPSLDDMAMDLATGYEDNPWEELRGQPAPRPKDSEAVVDAGSASSGG